MPSAVIPPPSSMLAGLARFEGDRSLLSVDCRLWNARFALSEAVEDQAAGYSPNLPKFRAAVQELEEEYAETHREAAPRSSCDILRRMRERSP